MTTQDFDLPSLQARAEITHVITEHIRAVDRKDWDLVRAGFHPDAVQDHGNYNGDVAGLIDWISTKHEKVDEYVMHLLGSVHIDLVGDRALAESSFLTFETIHRDGGWVHTLTGGRWIDRFESRDGGPWLIAKRLIVVHFTRGLPADDRDLLMAGAIRPSRSRNDPYYAMWDDVLAG